MGVRAGGLRAGQKRLVKEEPQVPGQPHSWLEVGAGVGGGGGVEVSSKQWERRRYADDLLRWILSSGAGGAW